MTTLSFPGLGIGEFTINPIAFTIPIGDGIKIHWYGLIIVVGMILAFSYCAFRAKQEGILFDDLLDIALFTIIFAVIGARAYYVLTSLDQYDNFLDAFKIWNGGLAIYGGIIAGAITIFIVCKVKKFTLNKTIKMFDAVAPAVMIGQIIGRWGNFCNGEAYGMPTDLPWRMCSTKFAQELYAKEIIDESTQKLLLNGTLGVHPTFFYEALWNLIGFILIHFLYKKKKFDGQNVLMYLTWYGFGRMIIEGLRTDSLYVGPFRVSQVVGFLCFVIGGILLTVLLVKAYRKAKDAEEYTYSYKKVPATAAVTENADADEVEEAVIINPDTSDNENEENEENEEKTNSQEDGE